MYRRMVTQPQVRCCPNPSFCRAKLGIVRGTLPCRPFVVSNGAEKTAKPDTFRRAQVGLVGGAKYVLSPASEACQRTLAPKKITPTCNPQCVNLLA